MVSRFVDDIPLEYQPKIEDHIEHRYTIRALKNNSLDIDSFLPSFLENKNSFFSQDASSYSLSLFKSKEQLISRFGPFSSFWKRHNGIAFGPTRIERGIALQASKSGHIDFYLFDAFGNNPCSDFSIMI